MAAITFKRLRRTLVSTTVRKAITNPAANPLIMLVLVMPNERSSCCDFEFHWFMIVSAIPTTPRPISAPRKRPRSAAISA